MNKTFACLIALALLGMTFASYPVTAQETAHATILPIVNGQIVGTIPYGCVAPDTGDGLWMVADRVLNDSLLWTGIFDKNAYLHQPERVTVKNGITYVLVRRTEKNVELLCGLNELGLVPKLATPAEMQALGLNLPTKTVTVTKLSPWWWLPLAILAFIALGLIALYAWLRRDPTRVGTGRVREAGIQNPQDAARYLRQQAAMAATGSVLPAQVRILNMVRGRAYGLVRIADRNGFYHWRILNGEVAWEVTTQLPNGTQEIRCTLLACANDVRANSGMVPGLGFRFTPEANVTAEVQPPVVVPTPAPAPAPAAPETQTPAPTARAAVLPEGMVRFEFKRATDGQPNVVRLQGVSPEDFFFESGPTATTFRYREVPKADPAPTETSAN